MAPKQKGLSKRVRLRLLPGETYAVPSGHKGAAAIAVIALFVAGVSTLVLIEQIEEPVSKDFLSASIGVLSALLISFVFQVRWLVSGLVSLLPRVSVLMLLAIFLLTIGLGVAGGLVALSQCDGAFCGSASNAKSVVAGLTLGASVLLIAVVVAVLESFATRPADE